MQTQRSSQPPGPQKDDDNLLAVKIMRVCWLRAPASAAGQLPCMTAMVGVQIQIPQFPEWSWIVQGVLEEVNLIEWPKFTQVRHLTLLSAEQERSCMVQIVGKVSGLCTINRQAVAWTATCRRSVTPLW